MLQDWTNFELNGFVTFFFYLRKCMMFKLILSHPREINDQVIEKYFAHSVLKIPLYNSLYNLTPTNRYVTRLKNPNVS